MVLDSILKAAQISVATLPAAGHSQPSGGETEGFLGSFVRRAIELRAVMRWTATSPDASRCLVAR